MPYPETLEDNFRDLCEKWAKFFNAMRAEKAVSEVKWILAEEEDGREVFIVAIHGHPRRGLKLVKKEAQP